MKDGEGRKWMNAALSGQTHAIRKAMEAEAQKVRAVAMTGSETPSITCPVCGRTSYHPDDVVNRYCGNCKAFHDSMSPILIMTSGVDYGERDVEDAPVPQLVSLPVFVDVLWGASMVIFFVTGKWGGSWLWLVAIIPLSAALIFFRVRITQANARIKALAMKPSGLLWKDRKRGQR